MSPLPLSHLPPLIPLPIFPSSSALPFPPSSPLSSIPELPSPSPLYHHNSLLLPLRHPLCMDQRGSQYSEDQGYGLRVKSETENYLVKEHGAIQDATTDNFVSTLSWFLYAQSPHFPSKNTSISPYKTNDLTNKQFLTYDLNSLCLFVLVLLMKKWYWKKCSKCAEPRHILQ